MGIIGNISFESSLSEEKVRETSTLSTVEKTALVYRAISKLNEEIQKKTASEPEEKRLIASANHLKTKLEKTLPQLASTPVPGCCHYNGKDYLVNVVTIAEKQERVEKAIQQFQATLEAEKKWYVKEGLQQHPISAGADAKVHEYFQRTLVKLQQGINVPLPDYYHATRKHQLNGIVETQTIQQSMEGSAGAGTYVSTKNEGDNGYGPHAFAIDQSCLVDSRAQFFAPQSDKIWIAVKKDIPIKEETVAFIDTSLGDEPSVKAKLQEKKLNIQVVDRRTSERIQKIFELSTQRRELPSFHWSGHSIRNSSLPRDMRPRSESPLLAVGEL